MASTVYTESVVTLNASQAEATLSALKSSADELRRKMIEATKLGNTEDAAKYQKQLDSVNKSMQNIRKETKDYSELMKKLNGATLNELAKAYSNLNKQIKNLAPGTKEFVEKSRQLKQVKSRMDEINGSVRGTNKTLDSLKGLLPKLGLATVFAVAGKAVVQFAKDAVAQTQLVGDRWAHFTYSAKMAYGTFVADLTSGKGWKELIENMAESYKVGQQVMTMLDELFELQNALTLKESEYNVEIERNKQIMRDQTKSDQERLDAADKAMSLEKELAEERKAIAAQEAEARKMELQDRTKMTDAELEAYIAGYQNNREIILQAQEYSAQVAELEKGIKSLTKAYNLEPVANAGLYGQIEAAEKKLADLKANTSDAVKEWVAIDAKYQISNDELVGNYVQALAKMNNADAEYYRSTTRMVSTSSSLRKELAKQHQAESDEAYKAEIAGVDQHQKEMELKAKEGYAAGELSEQQYQARLVSIQETALKSKKAIAERYKKETIDYQSQLLDLTIKQQEELKKILEEAEADAVKVFEDLEAESDAEMEAIMAEVDEAFQEQVDHLLDLCDQADEVRRKLDPSTALGEQLETEIAGLQEMYDNKLLSEEEFEQAKQDLIKDYVKQNLAIELEGWMKGIETAQQFCEQSSNAVSALQEAEEAALDAQMQAELTAAGDNAEERERIEAEYEQKKLDTQKKYAVADMVVNIAKTLAAGALAIMQAFAQLGPVAGAVMAGVIGVTTAAQVATIVAQKNAIMNTTINSSGSSASTTGARVATGYSSGGYTAQAGNDYQEVGVVHANEWVAPASMVRANPIVFRRLEQARKRGASVSGVAGFADGGMTSPQAAVTSAGVSTLDPSVLSQLTTVLQYIIDNGVPAYVLLSDLNSKQELSAMIKQKTGKK